MQVHAKPGDGACLYHSMLHGLDIHKRPADALALRQKLADWVLDHRYFVISGVTLQNWILWTGCSVEGYVSRQRLAGSWGGAIEMVAFSEKYQVNVHVYRRQEPTLGTPGGLERISSFDRETGTARTVNILYVSGSHFDALDPTIRPNRHEQREERRHDDIPVRGESTEKTRADGMGIDDEQDQGQGGKTTFPTFDAEPAGLNNDEVGGQATKKPSTHDRDGIGEKCPLIGDGEGGFSADDSTMRQKRPYKTLTPPKLSPDGGEVVTTREPEDMEISERDQGETDEHGTSSRVPNIRGELASEGAGAAGDTVATQGTSEDGDGEGDPATIERPNQSMMSRTQWKNFKKNLARKQGRQ